LDSIGDPQINSGRLPPSSKYLTNFLRNAALPGTSTLAMMRPGLLDQYIGQSQFILSIGQSKPRIDQCAKLTITVIE
jgi:hypothetical protein